MPPAVLQPRKHAKAHRQQALVDAATSVFAERGYDCATTREIAERAGVSEGLIHRYFGSKRGLLLAILEQKSRMVEETLRAGVPDRDDLHDEIRDIVLWSLDFMWRARDFMRVASAQGIIDADIGRFIGGRLDGERVRIIRDKLRRHKAAGRIRDDVDPAVVAQLISALTYESGFFMQTVFAMPRAEVKRIVREVVHIIVRGIEAQPTTDNSNGRRGASAC